MIRTGKDNYVFGSEGQFSEKMPEFAFQFKRMKKEKGIHTYMICRKDRKELDVNFANHKYLQNISESPAVTNIYCDKIAILIWTDEPDGIIIENEAAAKAYKSYFDFMWKNAKIFKKILDIKFIEFACISKSQKTTTLRCQRVWLDFLKQDFRLFNRCYFQELVNIF